MRGNGSLGRGNKESARGTMERAYGLVARLLETFRFKDENDYEYEI